MLGCVTARHRGSWISRGVPYGLALALFLCSVVPVAYQDAASLMERASQADERWRTTIVDAPYNSIHAAQVRLPVSTGEPAVAGQAVGVRIAGLGASPTAIMESGGDRLHTGSIAPKTGEAEGAVRYPEPVRETKGDFLMSRPQVDGRLRLDSERGLLKRMPRMLVDDAPPVMPRSSFRRPEAEGPPVLLASLGMDHLANTQAVLETPMAAFQRRFTERKEFVRDRQCMATAIYFEARGESELGQRAVAQVVMNRVADGRYPDSVCDVIYQNRHWRNRCQFSFACDGRPERIRDRSSWALAMTVAEDALLGHHLIDAIAGSTHYHATYVSPRWARHLNRLQRIGTHIFYKLRPGQT